MDLATPYRAPTFHAPRGPSADDLVEVIASWGDAVLSVTHVRAGEGFAWEGASLLRATAEGWAVTPPEGASAWSLREGEAAVKALREGVARVLAADERVGVALGEVTLRIARTAPPEALPRARGAVGFAAGVAFLLALVATGLAIAEAPEGDGTIARDDTAARSWLTAHVRPYVMRAPVSPPGTPRFPSPEAYGIVTCCFCPCVESHCNHGDQGSYDLLDPFVEFRSHPNEFRLRSSRGGRSIRVDFDSDAHARLVRRGVLRNIGGVHRCLKIAGDVVPQGHLAVRFVVLNGAVLASGVLSSTLAAPSVDDCVANSIRRWQFAGAPDGQPVTASVVFSVR